MKTWNAACLFGTLLIGSAAVGGLAQAKDGATPPLNACGCYSRDGACVCTTRVLRCECPDDCEPVGCVAKRQKELDRELAIETKRIQEENRKRDAAEKAKRAALEAKDELSEDDDVAPEPAKSTKGKGAKPSAKQAEATVRQAEKPTVKPAY